MIDLAADFRVADPALLLAVARLDARLVDRPRPGALIFFGQTAHAFHAGVKRFEHPHAYPAGLEQGLFERKLALVLKAKGH